MKIINTYKLAYRTVDLVVSKDNRLFGLRVWGCTHTQSFYIRQLMGIKRFCKPVNFTNMFPDISNLKPQIMQDVNQYLLQLEMEKIIND